VKILFALSSPEYIRFYDSAIAELGRRGHEMVIAVGVVRDGKPVRIEAIGGLHTNVTVAGLVPPRGDRWTTAARALRGTIDFVRYWHPELSSALLLRARVRHQALPWTLAMLDRIRSLRPSTVRAIMNGLVAVERALPPAASVLRFLATYQPDLVLVSPLVEPASDQMDLVRAAHARGTRVATLVASWDNLTNKGDLRVQTDLITVWNEMQQREAVELHRARPEQVVVTGAPVFDRWFDRMPSLTRDAFCRQVGLPADRPIVLFTGSSIFIARAETEMAFVRRWVNALRASADPMVRGISVLVRPHPYNGTAWNAAALADLAGVAVWPKGGYDPVDERSRAGFFDSMYHAHAVVGINTSAMIEAAIVGRPVLSIQGEEFAGTQDGTRHYRYLLPENGGFLMVASTLEEHADQVAAILRHPHDAHARLRAFVTTFVRPCGIDRPAMPVLVDAIEQFGASPAPQPVRVSVGDYLVRVALAPTALLAPWLCSQADRRYRMRKALWRGWQLTKRGGRHANNELSLTYKRFIRWPARRIARLVVRAWRAGGAAGIGAAAAQAVVRPVRRVRRILRLARYHVGMFARRLRGASTE
jgi:hypothetical protein